MIKNKNQLESIPFSFSSAFLSKFYVQEKQNVITFFFHEAHKWYAEIFKILNVGGS